MVHFFVMKENHASVITESSLGIFKCIVYIYVYIYVIYIIYILCTNRFTC